MTRSSISTSVPRVRVCFELANNTCLTETPSHSSSLGLIPAQYLLRSLAQSLALSLHSDSLVSLSVKYPLRILDLLQFGVILSLLLNGGVRRCVKKDEETSRYPVSKLMHIVCHSSIERGLGEEEGKKLVPELHSS